MPFSPLATEPKPTSDPWFVFEESVVGELIPSRFAGWITLAAIGIPPWPQSTADFCSGPPPTDMPTAEDYVSFGIPPFAFATGAYGRWGNLIRRAKWSELCQYVDPPAADGLEPPPAAFFIQQRNVCFELSEALLHKIPWSFGPLPTAAQTVAIRSASGPAIDGTMFRVTDRELHVGGVFMTPPDDAAILKTGTLTGPGPWWTVPAITSRFPPGYLSMVEVTPANVGQTLCLDIAVYYGDHEGTVQVPEPPELPDGYPEGELCADPTLADICKAIHTLDAKLNWLTAQQVPPVVIPDGYGIEAESGFMMERPLDAVGAVIAFTSIPEHIARFGDPPYYYSGLGHVAMLTLEDSTWPSVALKHAPQTLLPIPPQVHHLTLSLAPGVRAQVEWIRGSK